MNRNQRQAKLCAGITRDREELKRVEELNKELLQVLQAALKDELGGNWRQAARAALAKATE